MRTRSDQRSHSRSAAASPDVPAALDAFRRIVQALRMDGRAANQRAILSSAQLFALQQIAEHPNASINDLAALTFTHQSSVSVVIQRLVRRRLVAKVRAADDRRRQCLAVTAAGRKVLRHAPVAVQERLIEGISKLPKSDRRALARVLGRLAQSVGPTPTHPPMFFEDGAGAARRSSRHMTQSGRRRRGK